MKADVADPDCRTLIGNVRVYLDGEDVTDACRAFDTEAGAVELVTTDETGRLHLDGDGEWVTVEARGDVTIRLTKIPQAVEIACRAMGITREEFDRLATGSGQSG